MTSPARKSTDRWPSKTADSQVSKIIDTMREEIIAGILKPDEPLAQEQLASRFGVSRIPVREAIRDLENQGFVTIESNKRARVAPVNLADFLEIYDMRISAETLALRWAIPELSNSMIDQAAVIQKQIEAAPVGSFGKLNTEFHMALYRACARPRLLAHIRALGNAADRYLCMAIAGPDFRKKSDAEHHALLEACKARDTAAAIAVLEQHIGDARDKFAPMFDEL